MEATLKQGIKRECKYLIHHREEDEQVARYIEKILGKKVASEIWKSLRCKSLLMQKYHHKEIYQKIET